MDAEEDGFDDPWGQESGENKISGKILDLGQRRAGKASGGGNGHLEQQGGLGFAQGTAIEEVGLLGQLLVMAGQQHPVHSSGFYGGEDPVGGRAEGIDVLLAIKNTNIATSTEIQAQALPNLSKRAVQRYLRSLVVMGLVYTVGNNNSEYRYYLSGKAKQLFGVKG